MFMLTNRFKLSSKLTILRLQVNLKIVFFMSCGKYEAG